MTASLAVEVERRENVVLVPNRAIRTQGRNRGIEVMVDGKPEMRPVTTGLSDDQFTEVMGQLQVGDQVVVPSTTAVRPGTQGIGNFGGVSVPGFSPAAKPGGR
jgi:macrolide-specific efflux system membrane fusion protein